MMSGAVQLPPPFVVARYTMFHRFATPCCANHMRASPEPAASTTGAVVCAPAGESSVRDDHVSPPSVDVRTQVPCGPPGVVAPS